MINQAKSEIKPFAEIIKFAQDYPGNSPRFPVISFDKSQGYGESDRDRVMLNFTLHGDYVGSTLEKSNFYVLNERLGKAVVENLGLDPEEILKETFSLSDVMGIKIWTGSYSTNAIAIVGDMPIWAWEVIIEALESVVNYPLLDEDDHSERNMKDVWESWESWQYQDFLRSLRKYNLEPEEIFNNLCESDRKKYIDCCGWLWNILGDTDLIPAADQVDTLEINACAYYDFDLENVIGELDDFGTQVVDYLRSLSL